MLAKMIYKISDRRILFLNFNFFSLPKIFSFYDYILKLLLNDRKNNRGGCPGVFSRKNQVF